MKAPFSFLGASAGGGGGGGDYPATLTPTAYLKDFAGLPWVGLDAAPHTFDGGSASVGASFGSHASADFDGTSNYISDSTDAMSALISASAFTLQWIAQFDTAGADDASPDNEAGIIADANGYFRINYSTSGLRIAIYAGGTTAYLPLATGVKACIQAVLDAGTAKIRVNGGAWTSVASSDIADRSGHPILGANYSLAHKIDGRIAQFLAWDTALSGGTLDLLYADAQTNYGVP